MTSSENTTPTSAPIPGPRPGAKPGIKPSPLPGAVHTHQPSDPSAFGRVDEDGSVWVTTSAGDRLIGQWKAGTPEEGLAHYGARFEDLTTEADLLDARLKAHPEEAATIREQADSLRKSLAEAAAIGDLDALAQRLSELADSTHQVQEEAERARQARRAEAIAAKEKLAEEAEDIAANATNWKEAGDRMHQILTEWKAIRGINRKTNDELWKRYSAARDGFNRRRGAHFAELDRRRAEAKRRKQDLVERAEALQHSTDWRETSRAYRDLMNEWKAAGRASRAEDDRLWAAFRSAQDVFFAARDAADAQRDRELDENAQAKDALIAEYSPLITPEKNLDAAKAKLRELQEKWDEVGFVPRSRIREYDEKLAELEKRVSEAEEERWRRDDPEAKARLAQFEARVEELNSQAEAAAAKGNEKKAAELRSQAQQWAGFAEAARGALNS